MSDAAAIQSLLGDPVYARLFATVRRRIEHAGIEGARSVSLRELSERERRAVADLFGWPTLPDAPRIVLDDLDRVLRRSRVAAGLVDVLEALGGPLGDERARRAERSAAVEAMWTAAREHRAVRSRPVLATWLDLARRRGLVSRAARVARCEPDVILDRALAVVDELPARGVLLSVLAADTCDDPHALDPGQPLAGLVLRAAAALAGWPEVPAGAAARRRLWAEVGVLCDPLSSQVLVLGLRPRGGDRLARSLREAADAGEPQRLTLRELVRGAVGWTAEQRLLVCENPSVVTAAAEAHRASCAPLVCVEGMPSTAALELLAHARDAGVAIGVHVDFDWNGIRIGNLLCEHVGAAPWRASADDYRRAVAARAVGAPLSGQPVAASWDADLRAAMLEAGRAVYEEAVLPELLADLAT